uniref:Uncharacterized protein n=2 Tax=Physcomitrium patens TaxID=3218 RepID=A0A2K1KNG1_PHYPA|nr:hypothetical protein PHYPA_006220 [Physcomitrium patens]
MSGGSHFHVIVGNGIVDLSLLNGEIKTLKDIDYISSLYQNILLKLDYFTNKTKSSLSHKV